MPVGNSRKFYKRLSYYRKKTGTRGRRPRTGTPRVPRKTRRGRSYKSPRDHSDLFTDENPKGTVHGLKFKNKDEAKRSIRRLKSLFRNKKITYAHMRQIGTTMEQRAKYHAHPNKNIKEGMKIWKSFNRSFKKAK
jgi:hypothetical protein